MSSMLAEERRKKIRNLLQRDGRVTSAMLIKEFQVSEDTIRRDLKELADAGVLKKVHGGALASTSVPFAYEQRQELHVSEKSAIARRATQLIKDDMLIYVDGGTTAAQLGRHLPEDLRATFVTNSLATANSLCTIRQVEIILLGGKLIPQLQITAGLETMAATWQFKPDLAIMSAHGVTATAGATVESYEDASIKRAFIANSAEVAVLASQEKLGYVASYLVAEATKISYLISDASKSQLLEFANLGITIWTV